MIWMYLVLAINTANSSSIIVMPDKYEATQCEDVAKLYTWPWTAKCVPAPELSIMKREKL